MLESNDMDSPKKADQIRRMAGIPEGANVTYIDMGPGKSARTTFGWTDDQIRGKSAQELDSLVLQATLAVDSLRAALREQEDRAAGMRQIRDRKNDLGS